MNVIKNPFISFLTIYSLLLVRDFFDINIPIVLITIVVFLLALLSNEETLASLVVILIPIQEAVQLGTIYGFILLLLLIRNAKSLKLDILFILLIFIIVMEFLHIIVPPFSFDIFVKFAVTYLLLGFLLQRIDKMINKKTIILSYVYSVFISTMLILLITLKSYDYNFFKIIESGFRIGSTLAIDTAFDGYALSNNQNNLALQIVFVISLIMTQDYFKKNNRAIYALIGLLILLVGFLTQSRTFFVTLIFLFILLIIFNRKNIKKYIGIIFLSFLSVGIIFLINSQIFLNVLDRFNESNDLNYSRLSIFNLYNEIFISNIRTLLFGIGMQNMHLKVGYFAVPHNSIQEVYIAWGVIGLSVIGIFIFSYLKKFYRRTPIKLIPFLVLIFFSQFGRLFKNSNIVMLLLICAIVLSLKESRGVINEQKNNINL
jgi:hypothetical protein